MTNAASDDPFRAGSRTVIRPRRPVPPAAAPATPQPAAPHAPPPPAASVRAASGPMPASSAIDMGLSPLTAAEKVDLDVPNANPIVRAATPLLLMLSQLRFAASPADVSALHREIAADVKRFHDTLAREGVASETIRIAAYALCATADDIVQNLPSDGRYLWTQNSMLSLFFGERTAGVRFFSSLDQVKANPAANRDLLELMYDCLALGFEGVHRTTAGGQAELQKIRRDVFETLRAVKPRAGEDISPRWQGVPVKMREARFPVPVWVVAAVLAVVLLGVFLALKLALGRDIDALAARMATIHPAGPVELGTGYRPTMAPDPPSTTQLQRIEAGLDGLEHVSIHPTANDIVVRVGNLLLFPSGSATVRPSFEPVAQIIAEVLEPEADFIRIVGHTDSVPASGTRFSSNHELSTARAEAAAAVVRGHLADPGLVIVEGRGASEPIADNGTAAGRAQNRRVELVVPRRE